MKKRYFWYASMLLAALSLVLTACNQGVTAGNGTDTVQVVIGGGAARSVYPDSRMPVFDNENTTIIVSKKDGTVLKRGTTAVTLTLDIGTKIIVKAVVKTKAGEWRGSAEHTVTAGTNTVAVRLSQLPMSMGNILIDVNAAQTEVTLKLTSGKELLNGVQIGHNYMTPVTARDGKGRIYVLYHKSGFRFTRFDADGELDSEFETAIMAKLPSGISASIMAVDAKTNTIFVVDVSKHVYAVTETSHNVFTCSSGFDLAGLSAIGSYDTIQTGAAYDGVLFLAVKAASTSKLLACKADITGTGFTLIEKNTAQLPKLRNSLVMSVDTKCTGLFADAKGVYCLLQEQKLDGGSVYAVGSFVHYTYDAKVLTEKAVAGLNPNAADTARPSLAYDDDFFSSPAGFIGYDEKYIYIADDGVDIKDDTYIGWCITGNKNRIIPFDRNAETVSFDSASSAPAWFTEYTGYQYAAKIPNLLWTKKK